MSDTNKPPVPKGALAAARRRMAGALDALEAELGEAVRRPPRPRGVALLLIDASSSMSGHKLQQAVQGAIDFSETALRDGLEVGVIAFASDAVLLTAPATDRDLVAKACRRCRADGSTNLHEALSLAMRTLDSRMGLRRYLVVITDGQPDDEAKALAVADRIKAGGTTIATIGTDDANLAFLQRLASQAGFAKQVGPTLLADTIRESARLLSLDAPRK